MWKMKSCPRCSGDVIVDRDIYGWYEWCFQCGYHRERQAVPGSRLRAATLAGERTACSLVQSESGDERR
jgi:hypothetical protein